MPPTRLRRLALLLAWSLALAFGLAGTTRDARAECVAAGNVVTCAPPDDTDGFDAGGADEFDVTVENTVTVSHGAGMSVIVLDERNTVQIDAGGTVSAIGNNANAIEIGKNNNVGTTLNGTADGVTNDGTITADGDDAGGILGGDANDVVNNGLISTGGPAVTNPFGISLGNDGVVVNSTGATITVTGAGAVGIDVGTQMMNDDSDDVSNAGTITVDGEAGAATGIRAGDGTEIVNVGTVSATSIGGTAVGIEMGDDSDLLNLGTISATGTGNTGVRATAGAMGSTISNQGSGRIEVDFDGTAAIDLSGSAGMTTIDNSGTIASGDVDTFGTAIRGSAMVEEVTSSGQIIGDVLLMGGDDILTLAPGAGGVGMFDGGGDLDDQLHLDGLGSVNLDLDRVTGFDSLTMGATAAGNWLLSSDVSPPTFPGGVSLMGGTLSLLDTVEFTGNFTQETDTTFQVVFDPVTGDHGRLNLLGASMAEFIGTNTLELIALSPIVSDTTLTILDFTGGNVLGDLDVLPMSTPILTYTLTEVADTLELEILRASYGSVAQTSNQSATASYLDTVLAAMGNNLGVQSALLELDTLSASQLRTSYDSFHPEAYDAHTSTMVALGRAIADAASRPRLHCKPPLYGLDPSLRREIPCGRTGFTAWLRIVVSTFDRDAGADFFTSDGTSQALAGGFDWRPDPRVALTGWAGLGSADLDVDPAGAGDLETIEIGVAASARLGPLRARAALGYGRGTHEQSRSLELGDISLGTDGEYNSNRIHGLLEIAWLFEIAGLQIEPLAGLDVSWISEEAFDESDANGIELSVEERDNTLFSTEFGGRIRYRHYQNPYSDSVIPYTQGTWTPEVSASWRSTWTGSDRELEARMRGAADSAGSFSVDSEDSEQGVDVGGRLTFQPHGSGGSFSIGYDGFFGDAGTDHRFSADLEVYF